MKMSLFVERFSSDLSTLGKLGGSELEAAVSRLIPTLGPVLSTRLLEALSEVVADLKSQLPGASVEARLNGDEIELVYLPDDSLPKETPTDLTARITLRLPEDLKSRIETAATKEGISLNSWLLKASERGSFAVSIGGRQLKGKGRS